MDQLKHIYATLYRVRSMAVKYRPLMNAEQRRDFEAFDQYLQELHAMIYGGKHEQKSH